MPGSSLRRACFPWSAPCGQQFVRCLLLRGKIAPQRKIRFALLELWKERRGQRWSLDVQRTGFTQHFREELLTTTGVLALRVLWITKLGCFLRPPQTRLGLEGGKFIWPPSWGCVIRWAPCDSVPLLSRVKTCNILRVWSATIDSQAPFSAKNGCVEVEREQIFACHSLNRFPSSVFCQERLCEDRA